MNRRVRPVIGQKDPWDEWQSYCLACLRLALARLRGRESLPEGENSLNTCLFDQLRIAARELCPLGSSYPPIRAECQVQPYGESDESHRRLKAAPDITWGYEDDREPNPLKATRDFVIECKRVRSPTTSGWIFTKHYVDDGVSRFMDAGKRYGEGVSSAAMVGFWQDGADDSHQSEINSRLKNASLPALASASSNSEGIGERCHTFTRSFVISPFRLLHLWVDLRHAYQTEA